MKNALIAVAVASAFMPHVICDESTETGATGGGPTTKPAKPKPDVLKVKMSDGREVEFVGKRKMLKETLIDGSTVTVRLDFRNGNTVNFTVPDQLLLKAAGHGIEQKLGDETAGEDDVDDMQLAVEELAERLKSQGLEGWAVKREGGGMSGTSVLLKALVELTRGADEAKGMTEAASIEKVKAFLKDKKQAEKMALRNSPKVKPIVERLEAEKVSKAANVDTDALLGQLAT